MLREATCACGQFGLSTIGQPKVVASCSCLQCQKRTGSVFGVSSYFDNQQVIKSFGEFTEFLVKSDAGRVGTRRFCPQCGTTVCWFTDLFSGKTGIAVGCFADPTFPEPKAHVWLESKHAWVTIPGHWYAADQQDFPAKVKAL